LQEIKKIIQGLDGIKVVGADIVEVAPVYDTQGQWFLAVASMILILVLVDEITAIAAANIGWDILALMAKNPLTT
jgi:agmatinase